MAPTETAERIELFVNPAPVGLFGRFGGALKAKGWHRGEGDPCSG